MRRLGRGPDGGFDGEDLLEAVGGDLGAWQERHEHDGDENGEEDLHHVVEEGREVADLHLAVADAQTAEPHDAQGGEIHNDRDRGEEQGEEVADAQGRVGELVVGAGEDLAALLLTDEGADDAYALDLLAHDEVDAVDTVLHGAEARQEPAGEDADDGQQQGDEHEQQGGQGHVHAQGHDGAAHKHDRCHEHHGRDHEDDHLDLLDVVGGARDE